MSPLSLVADQIPTRHLRPFESKKEGSNDSDANDRLISQSQSLYHFCNVFRFVPLRFLKGKFFKLWFIQSTKNLGRKHGSPLVVICICRVCLILVAHDSRISNATIRLLEKTYTALEAKNI